MWKVVVYDTMYGCMASATIYAGDKASAKAIARHYNSLTNLPECIYYDAAEDTEQD